MVLRTIVVFCGNIYNYARDSKEKRGLVNFLLAFYKFNIVYYENIVTQFYQKPLNCGFRYSIAFKVIPSLLSFSILILLYYYTELTCAHEYHSSRP